MMIFLSGLLKSIGVSNYTVKHLEELLQYATVVPAVLQVWVAGPGPLLIPEYSIGHHNIRDA